MTIIRATCFSFYHFSLLSMKHVCVFFLFSAFAIQQFPMLSISSIEIRREQQKWTEATIDTLHIKINRLQVQKKMKKTIPKQQKILYTHTALATDDFKLNVWSIWITHQTNATYGWSYFFLFFSFRIKQYGQSNYLFISLAIGKGTTHVRYQAK